MNIYGEGDAASGVVTSILTYQNDKSFGVTGFVGWGEAAAEFLILKNNQIVGGAHTSDQVRTIQISFDPSPVTFDPADVLAVTAEHAALGTRTLRINVLGKFY